MDKILETYRSEIKYIIPRSLEIPIRKDLNSILTFDKHSGPDGYTVRSMYFDSLNNIDYSTKSAGTMIRKKIRLRTYGDSQIVKLELKQKKGNLQHKESLVINRTDAERLISGDCSVLTDYFHTGETAKKLYLAMERGVYRPVNIIEYDRLAFCYPLYDTRITIDRNIRTREFNRDFFNRSLVFSPENTELSVLEVKFNKHLMNFISQVLSKYNLTEQSYSKYYLGRPVFEDFNY